MLVLVVAALPLVARAQDAASAAVYVRHDTDHTRVISPRLKLQTTVAEQTQLDLAYSVDVWTSASVDIVASASQPVTEQRDELNVAATHAFEDFTIGGAYRFSIEPDYESHGGSLNAAWDFANKAATLKWSAGGSADHVGRAGDPNFSESASTLTTGLTFTQVLDVNTLLQLQYDLAAVRGYQASAYRFVSFGSPGPCRASAPLCRPERDPRERLRHALAIRARRALGTSWSLGAGYRAYLDDWGIFSHTAKADLAWAPQRRATIALSYRFYTQSAADHYKPVYSASDVNLAYFARDKELSPLASHRAALELDWVWPLRDAGAGVLTALAVAGTFYRYRDFPMLDHASALEVTAVVGMEFE